MSIFFKGGWERGGGGGIGDHALTCWQVPVKLRSASFIQAIFSYYNSTMSCVKLSHYEMHTQIL